MGPINRIFQQIICVPIRLYQYVLRPVMKPCCRYYPSCSEYALNAINNYGISKGIWMASKRIMRCHPWAGSGYDPVPPNNEKL
ncbi:MAG: membrane protein insertion efficiency factor YidD [Legionella sp.]|jgi:hypothetical protein